MKNNNVSFGVRFGRFGFSLVELLVVISIIGVLSSVLFANFMGARERARDAQRIQDLLSLKNALRMYYNDHQSYPNGLNDPELANYMPGMGTFMGVGLTYEPVDNRDGFNLCSTLEAGNGDDDVFSQKKCGIGSTTICGMGTTVDKFYVVCAK